MDNDIKVFLRVEPEPPRVTHQQKKIVVRDGKPHTYEDSRLKEARQLFLSLLAPYKPEKPWKGAIYMGTKWFFKGKKDGYFTKRPDCDNLQKLLQDCMTQCGFWEDDSQVMPFIQKFSRAEEPHGVMIELRRIEE